MFERFTAAARQTVLRAVREAQRAEAAQVTSEHITLALVDDPTTAAGRLLEEHGVLRADVVTAFQEARRRGGLSETDAEALRELGIDVSDVVDNVERSLGQDALSPAKRKRRRRFLAPRGHIPFSDDAKRLLERTLTEALDLGARHLRDEHILLALVARGGVAAESLGKKDVTYEEVRTRLRACS